VRLIYKRAVVLYLQSPHHRGSRSTAVVAFLILRAPATRLQSPHHRGSRSSVVPGSLSHPVPTLQSASSSGKLLNTRACTPPSEPPRLKDKLRSLHHRGNLPTTTPSWWSSAVTFSPLVGEVSQRSIPFSGTTSRSFSPLIIGEVAQRAVTTRSTATSFSPLIIGEVAQPRVSAGRELRNERRFGSARDLQSPHHRGSLSTRSVLRAPVPRKRRSSVPSSSGKPLNFHVEVSMGLSFLQSPHHRGSRSTSTMRRSDSRTAFSPLIIGEVAQQRTTARRLVRNRSQECAPRSPQSTFNPSVHQPSSIATDHPPPAARSTPAAR
jgi:hypothetical protein